MILLFVLVGITATYIFSELQTPVYRAETKIKIETQFPKDSVAQKYNNFHMDLARLKDHAKKLTSENVLQELAKETDTSLPDLNLATKLNPETLEINLKVLHHHPATAILVANTAPEVYKKYFLDEDAVIKSVVTVLSSAKSPLEITKPNSDLNLSIAFVSSLTLGFFFSVFWKKSQQKISTEQDAQKNFGLPVLGAIPKPR